MCPILASTIWCFLEVTTGLKALWVSTDQSVAQLLLLQALPRALLCSRVITVINNYQEKKKKFFFLADAFYWVWIKLLWLSTFYEMNKGMILAKVFLYSCQMLFVRLISIAVTVTYSRSTGSLFSRFHLFWCDLFLCRQLAVTDCSAHCCPSLLGHLCRESLAWVCTSIKETIPASETESPLKQSRVNKKRIIIYIYC